MRYTGKYTKYIANFVTMQFEIVKRYLAENPCLVVTAPPGAGKSTILPLDMLSGMDSWSPDVKGKILMLEPRRIAARQIARRMASTLGESVGETVGYRMRFENRVSSKTRLEVITEGILTRMLVDDPLLEGVSAVIFDEFHERSLNCDVALALTRESIRLARPDLRLVVMSATIDSGPICKELGASLLECEGRMFPVEIIHSTNDTTPESAAADVARMVREAHSVHEGDILAFLPGEADICRCAESLKGTLGSTEIYPLYGMLSPKEQKAAIAPSLPGHRKVVLATPVAETSLTIEGVRVVIDSGLCRRMVFNPQNGLSHLETVRISMDMADQRSGRAGRVAAGVCYRLWSKNCELRMASNRTPEIMEADLTSTLLDIAAWGEGEFENLPWFDMPPEAHIRQARTLLELMGAVDEKGKITALGKRMAAMPCYPRMAKMLLEAQTDCAKALAADLAALLEEKDPLSRRDGVTYSCDICNRVEALRRARRQATGGQWGRIIQISEQYRNLVKVAEDNAAFDPYQAGSLIAAAYPERIAKTLQEGSGRYQLSNGESALLEREDILSSMDWIAIASLSPKMGAFGRIFLAAPLDIKDLERIAQEKDTLGWDARNGCITARRERRIGSLTISSKPLGDISRDDICEIICTAAVKNGLSMLDFNDSVRNLQRRIAVAASWHPELGLPDLSDEKVLERASEWLPMYIGKATTTAELKKIDLCSAFWGLLSYEQQQTVDRLAPSHVTVPTGSRIHLEYRSGAEVPILRVRLQECFGLLDTPTVDDGRRSILLELLSPGFKPVQLTSDLRSFWSGTYFEVRKELKRRYPKHSWPDNPLDADPIRGTKKTR